MPLRPSDIPNALCILRMFLVVPIVLSVLRNQYALALGLVLVAGASDGLDGFLAKRFDWRSRLGGILDPVADKLLMTALFITLAWKDLVPVWLTLVVIGRDLLIVGGGSAYNYLIGPVHPAPSSVSKLNTVLQLLFLLLLLIQQVFGRPDALWIIALGAGVFVTSVVSGLDYVLTWGGKAWSARRTAQ